LAEKNAKPQKAKLKQDNTKFTPKMQILHQKMSSFYQKCQAYAENAEV